MHGMQAGTFHEAKGALGSPLCWPADGSGLAKTNAPALGGVAALPALASRPEAPVCERKARAPLTAEQESLLLEHLPVVRAVARQIRERLPPHIDIEELIGAGTVGLLDAVLRFDADKGAHFRSYAQFRVRGAILDSLRALDWSPRELRRKGRLLAETVQALTARMGRLPQETEIAAALSVPLENVQQLTAQIRNLEIGSLHVERGEDSGEEELAFLPACASENPLFQYLKGEDRRRLIGAIDALPERERLVMTLRYFEEKTMKEIGQVLGVVESRVSQLHHAALVRLRSRLRDVRGRRFESTTRARPMQRAS